MAEEQRCRPVLSLSKDVALGAEVTENDRALILLPAAQLSQYCSGALGSALAVRGLHQLESPHTFSPVTPEPLPLTSGPLQPQWTPVSCAASSASLPCFSAGSSSVLRSWNRMKLSIRVGWPRAQVWSKAEAAGGGSSDTDS